MRTHFSKGGLRQWVAEKWVDIGAPKKNGKYQPANDKVDKFGYKITIEKHHQSKVAKGEATLLAHIDYKCPEGEVVVNYPDHQNLRFNIL